MRQHTRQGNGRTSTRSGKNQLRIIGGKWRGRKLSFPDLQGLRPTGDRIRETLFNWLTPFLPGARCLDLFAGSAALGLEALSRGASEVIFVEKNASAADSIANNCTLLGADNSQLHRTDALAWLAKPAVTPFDIIFLDPPFSDNLINPTLDLLQENHYAASGTLVYLETARVAPLIPPANWQLFKEKFAGQVAFRLYLIA